MNDKEAEQYVFKFECSEIWESLTETEAENVRHCRRCDKNVHLVQNYNEFMSNAEKGNCVYSIVGRTVGVILPPEDVKQPQFTGEPQVKSEPQFIKRIFQFLAVFIVALPFVGFLPLYIRRTMTRSQMTGNGGDVIDYGWNFSTLYGFWADYNYFRPEENFPFWLAVNLGLACVYAYMIALFIILLLIYRKRLKK